MARKKTNKRQKTAGAFMGSSKKMESNSSTLVQKVTAPSAGSTIVHRVAIPPKINSLGRSTFVRNTELLTTIQTVALSAYNTNRGNLIPGNLTWLTGLAANFSKWRWRYLKLIYVPVCPTTTVGQVVMGLGYDQADVIPTTLAQVQQYYESVTAPVWAGFDGSSELNTYTNKKVPGAVCLELDVNRLGGATGPTFYRYITQGNVAPQSATDRNMFVPAYVDISTIGGTVLTLVGNLFCEYVIELVEPIPLLLNF